MARVLIVGCGCRGRELGAALGERGHAVRGTSRDPRRIAAIEATGAEAVVADPLRLGTLIRALEGVSVLCWLLGSAQGSADTLAALHGPRLESMLAAIVDSAVRGVVYESAGSVPRELLRGGAQAVDRAARSFHIPTALIADEPVDLEAWRAGGVAAVESVLAR